ncbi:hypothetical protein, partial [Antrihabitans spumae]
MEKHTVTFSATVLGTPRIGPRRELKRAIESYWAGKIDQVELASGPCPRVLDTLNPGQSPGEA